MKIQLTILLAIIIFVLSCTQVLAQGPYDYHGGRPYYNNGYPQPGRYPGTYYPYGMQQAPWYMPMYGNYTYSRGPSSYQYGWSGAGQYGYDVRVGRPYMSSSHGGYQYPGTQYYYYQYNRR